MHAGNLVEELLDKVVKVMDRQDEFIDKAMTELAFACTIDQLSWKDRQLVEWVAAVRREQSNGRAR